MSSEKQEITFEEKLEEDRIGRSVVAWLNTYPELPHDLANGIIDYEFLAAEVPAMSIATVQGTYVIRRNIIGGYEAEYQFKLIYRINVSNADQRLKADEILNRIGEWAKSKTPYLGAGIKEAKFEPVAQSSLFGRYENGDEDHQIFMKLTYKVSPRA